MPDRVELRAWRGTRAESAFVEGVRAWLALDELGRQRAASLHWNTCWFQQAALDVYVELLEEEIPISESRASPAPFCSLERKVWSFLQLAKAALDAVAREINLVYWYLDPQRRFFDPAERTRWVTFYTVREKLLSLEEFREDPLARMLAARTRATTADPIYRDLSDLAAASLTSPPAIERIEPVDLQRASSPLRVRQVRLFLPDDPRVRPFTYERGFEVNALFPMILRWLELFTDEVYDKLDLRLRGDVR